MPPPFMKGGMTMLKLMTITAEYKITLVKHVYAEDNEKDSQERESDKFEKELSEIFDPMLQKDHIEDYIPYGCKYHMEYSIEKNFD